MRPNLIRLTAIVCLTLASAVCAGASDTPPAAPPALAIAYHVAPRDRAALRRAIEAGVYPKFAELKKRGDVADFRILYSRYADSPNWDAMLLVRFSVPASFDRWNKLEGATAGLDKAALDLVTSIESVPIDIVRSQGPTHTARPGAVFLVIPYEVLVSSDEYLQYLDGYTVPQFDGWMKESVLSGYAIAMARYPAGRPWSSLILLEYAGDDALNQREVVVAKVRAKLKEDVKWKAISDAKKSVRSEKEVVVAEEIAP